MPRAGVKANDQMN